MSSGYSRGVVEDLALPRLDDVEVAARCIEGKAHQTAVLTCEALDTRAGAELFFKCENFQKTGAFKFRGATNAVGQLDDTVTAVATHSSGNHGAALAAAARARGIAAHVVMPENAAAVKRRAVENYGGQVVACEATLEAREVTLERVVKETGAVFIPPFNHPHIIAGQGTAALELLDAVEGLEVVVAPVGGGGLVSGTGIVAKERRVDVFAAEPEQADDAARSFRSGKIEPANSNTIADGLLTSLGPLTFAAIRETVADVVTVSEAEIVTALRLTWERMKIVIEPSSAVAVAAVLKDERFRGRRVGVILSGGNVDLDSLHRIFNL
tara:strand:- start:1129 stop:2103 length:975 start_codon:yes stop_codon:yes gene_type:complete